MTYRTNTAPVPATRPVLTRWQRAVLAALGDVRCTRFAWFRAHVGGAWTFYGGRPDSDLPFDPQTWQRRESEACAICNLCTRLRAIPPFLLMPGEARYLIQNGDHRCEVYPWPSLYTRQTPEEAHTFEEFRQWYEGVRVVDLSRVGKVTR